MAKYCIHCGKKLEDGEVCACQVKKNGKNILLEITDIFKGMFLKPIDTLKKYTDEKYFNSALIITGIFVLVFSLFMISLVSNASQGLGYFLISFRIPYVKIFFLSFFGMAIYTILYVGFLYLVNAIIFKGSKSFKKTFVMYGINLSVLTVFTFISMILMFLSSSLGLLLLIFGFTLNMLYNFKGLEYLGVKDKNKHGYIYLIVMVFCIFFLMICMLFMNRISSNSGYGFGQNTVGHYSGVGYYR